MMRSSVSRNLWRSVGVLIGVGTVWTAAPLVHASSGLTPAAPAAIAQAMANVHESQVPTESFAPMGSKPVTTVGSHGDVLTAIVGTRSPTADGYGQLVFFFDQNRFIGLNSTMEASEIRSVRADGPGKFVVQYADYAPNDPMFDPSRPPVNITYTETGSSITASEPLPAGVGDRLTVRIGSVSPKQSGKTLFQLTHHPFGFFGSQWVPDQAAADQVISSKMSLWTLVHRPVGYFGQSAVALQLQADRLWKDGVRQ